MNFNIKELIELGQSSLLLSNFKHVILVNSFIFPPNFLDLVLELMALEPNVLELDQLPLDPRRVFVDLCKIVFVPLALLAVARIHVAGCYTTELRVQRLFGFSGLMVRFSSRLLQTEIG